MTCPRKQQSLRFLPFFVILLTLLLAACTTTASPPPELVETAVSTRSQPTETAVPPTNTPTSQPTVQPTDRPTNRPTNTPTHAPTNTPTHQPTIQHTHTPTAPPTPTPAPQSAVWLDYLNDIRQQAGLPTVSEDTAIAAGAQAHSEYMGRNDNPVARTQLVNNIFYSDEGRIAAQRSNIFALSSPGGTDLWGLNFWLSAPFHALGLLDPQLEQVGYGRFRDDLGVVQIAAVLDVLSGINDAPPNVTYPIFYPPNGGQSYALRQILTEYPEPTASCEGYEKPTGPPLILQLGAGQLTPNVTDFRVIVDGAEVEACAFDETNYSNRIDHAQTRGRQLLDWRDAVVLIPRQPFHVGQVVEAEVTANGTTYSWSFTTANAPYIDIEPIPLAYPDELYGTTLNIAGFSYGGQTHDLNYPTLMKNSGMTWVKFQLKWRADSRPEEIVERLTLAKAHGFKVLVSVTGDPYPTDIDYDAFTQFMGGLAALSPAPDAIEVWNEMNIDFEWPVGEIDPAVYTEKMLKPAYDAIKAQNRNIVVISGAPAPTGFDNGVNAWASNRYFKGMVEAGATNYLDCVGVHSNEGAVSPYERRGHPAGGYYGWYFLPSMESVFFAFGGARPLCITELGILSGDGYGGLPSRFWWAGETSADEQAQWLAEALTLANQSGYVRLAILFNVDIFHFEEDPQGGFAIIRPGGDCPFCTLVQGN